LKRGRENGGEGKRRGGEREKERVGEGKDDSLINAPSAIWRKKE